MLITALRSAGSEPPVSTTSDSQYSFKCKIDECAKRAYCVSVIHLSS